MRKEQKESEMLPKEQYAQHLRKMLNKAYSMLKATDCLEEGTIEHVNGYMHAGVILGVMTSKELEKLIDEENQKIFGMGYQERMRQYPIYPSKRMDDKLLKIPTYIRNKFKEDFLRV